MGGFMNTRSNLLVTALFGLVVAMAAGCREKTVIVNSAAIPPATTPLVHVFATFTESTVIPADAFGFVITANGQGGYTVAWTHNAGLATRFSGTLHTNGTFSQVQKLSGAETVVNTTFSQIDFVSVPGADVDGVTFVSS